jgi:predicted ATPase/DNA-binding SARP family transcriptional activator
MSEPSHHARSAAAAAADARASLPTELTSFIGRDRELADVGALLDRSRLVTLTGPAGSGKTRLAAALVAARAADPDGDAARPAGAAWVELAGLREPGLIAPAIAEAAGLREEIRSGDVTTVVRLLQRRPLLLVLDNCEHLVEACAEVADALLRECAGLTILATSREALGVRGERAWLVPPLGLPSGTTAADATASEAVRLFAERAADVVPDFELTADSALIVGEICRRLDGIPLAIELAAARVKVLSVREIRDRLDDVFRLLTGGSRTAVPRHRTLRAAIDWSYELLPADERVLLRRLSVFRGGFSLEAAERVGAGEGVAEGAVLDLLAGLVDRSIVTVREQHDTARYFLLEAVRQYAARLLTDAGEEPATRQRFVDWIADEVADAEPHFTRQTRRARVERLYRELDNIRSALSWSREHDPALHVRLAGMLWWFWFATQHWTEGGRWIEGALRLPAATEPTRERAALLFAAGALSALQARAQLARAALLEAIDIARRTGDGRLEAYALNYLAMTYAGEGSSEALQPCRSAEAWFREHDDLYGLRLALLLQGSMALGGGAMAEAERLNAEGVRVARRFGQPRELAVALQNLASVYIAQGRLTEAEDLVREALTGSQQDPSYYFIAVGIGYLGEIVARIGHPLAGARLLACAEAAREAVGARAFPLDRVRQERLAAELRAADATAFDVAWQEGRLLDPMLVMAEYGRVPAGATRAVRPAEPNELVVVDLQPAVPQPASRTRPARQPLPPPGQDPTEHETPATLRPQLRVRALGPVVVEVDGEPVEPDRWPYGKPKELLLYLLLHPRGASRDQIGEALWPGAARANVKNSFHVTLHHVRRALGRPEWIVREADRYRLDPGLRIEFDASEFEADARAALRHVVNGAGAAASRPAAGALDGAAAGVLAGTAAGALDGRPVGALDGAPGALDDAVLAALQRTRARYQGDLLEGESAGRWLDDHRDRLRRLYLDVSIVLGGALEAREPDSATALYEALVAREELDEELHRRLMRLRVRAGDRVRALRHYDRLVALLRHTLDAEPEPETVALYESIRTGSLTPPI